MTEGYYQLLYYLSMVFSSSNLSAFFLIFFPFVLIIELPFYLITILYSIKGWIYMTYKPQRKRYYPIVTVVIVAYNESFDVMRLTLQAVAEQLYAGKIETLIIIDDAIHNKDTAKFAHALGERFNKIANRKFTVVEKLSRGGHANSMNLGLKLAKGEVLFILDADTSIDNQTVTNAVSHFQNPNVIAVSGAVRVRNMTDSVLTRLQAIEFMIGIQLGRFGLSELNVINNISGAFGIFKTSFLRQIGGWLNGTAEDLDLTLRLHVYASRYPQLKIVHEPFAIAWTAAPVTFRDLMKQRMRWDGDLFYIYVRRHWRKFSSNMMSRTKLFFFSWYGLYYQLALPFIIVFYTVVLFFKFSLPLVIFIFIIIYIYYLFVGLFMYLLFLILVSERPKQDFYMIGWVFLMPVYQQVMRFMATFFILNEIIFKGHEETSMAPWWVLRKTK